jgi:hypothetical protein
MGTIKATNIEPIADNGTVTLGSSGDTLAVGSGVTANGFGIGGAEQYMLTANYAISSADTDEVLTSNWSEVSTVGNLNKPGKIGSLTSQSSGIFSFSQTGIYKVSLHTSFTLAGTGNARYNAGNIEVTNNNSSYTRQASGYAILTSSSGGTDSASSFIEYLLDVDDTSNVKVRISVVSNSADTEIRGNTNYVFTNVLFTRLGDT